MTMIIDGMTQSTTVLPHFVNRPSWVDKLEYDVHVIGSIIETIGVHMEFSYKNIGDNTNVLIDTINSCIQRMHEFRKSRSEPLPEVLYLQLDNVNHNKSKVLMTFLSLLVEKNIFKKVKVNYLLVGHTHEIIDQVFSRFSVLLRKTTCLTLQELMTAAKSSYTPAPTVSHVSSVTDWGEWFTRSNSLHTATEALSFNHAFRIKRNINEDSRFHGQVTIHSKRLGWREPDQQKEWRPRNGVLQLLRNPEGSPKQQLLKALDDKQMQQLNKILIGFERNLGEAFTGDVKDYWVEALSMQENIAAGQTTTDGWEYLGPLDSSSEEGTLENSIWIDFSCLWCKKDSFQICIFQAGNL